MLVLFFNEELSFRSIKKMKKNQEINFSYSFSDSLPYNYVDPSFYLYHFFFVNNFFEHFISLLLASSSNLSEKIFIFPPLLY
jgi:hypothetical protein